MLNRLMSFYRRRFYTAIAYAKFIGVSIGNDCHIATKEFGSEPYLITIGNKVQVTNGVRFLTHSGGWCFRNKYPNLDAFGKIIIKDNVYIGSSAIILPGVTIGCNTMIGAGSVVTKSVPDNTVVAGNPAKVIASIAEVERKFLSNNVESKGMNYLDKKMYLLSLPDEKFIRKP